ncbi:DUF3817 domain-containing protein [Falsarthrobacter nasiphocae]|uniref:Integral membrane protein n=1 Tax=Falsarthrobacter nasiphocae TaxID=189863 RepID=A0AAE3YH26_9MICC|nr:DUF3817 domain-containing protein [Falsarthrobacter nasiphocae]MDR6892055.1 integral membrane protein [Falsarthrobacter nasiphocae]
MTLADPAPQLMSPVRLYRLVARAEAVTWALLLIGMALKYVTKTTELGVRIGGLLHGIVFISYVVVTVAVWIDSRWSLGRGLLGLGSSILPFATLPFESDVEAKGKILPTWRLASPSDHARPGQQGTPRSFPERVLAGLLAHPSRAVVVGVALVVVLTVLALLVGPPGSSA